MMNTRDIQIALNTQPSDITFLDDSILLEREKEISKLHAQMQDVNELMRELYKITVEQSPGIDTISTHITHSAVNVEAGKEQIVKAEKYLEKSSCSLI